MAFGCAARGDVARAARVAFTMLLEGFRARDGFLALQSRAEYDAAAAAAGEVSERGVGCYEVEWDACAHVCAN